MREKKYRIFTREKRRERRMQNALFSSKFYLTSRAGEQLPDAKERRGSLPEMGDYISTVEQSAVVTHNENDAIRYNSLANFSLKRNSSVKYFNACMRQAQMREKIA